MSIYSIFQSLGIFFILGGGIIYIYVKMKGDGK